MPAEEQRDDQGVPFLVAPVRSEDPKRSDEDQPKSSENGVKSDLNKSENAAADSDELVSTTISSA